MKYIIIRRKLFATSHTHLLSALNTVAFAGHSLIDMWIVSSNINGSL